MKTVDAIRWVEHEAGSRGCEVRIWATGIAASVVLLLGCLFAGGSGVVFWLGGVAPCAAIGGTGLAMSLADWRKARRLLVRLRRSA